MEKSEAKEKVQQHEDAALKVSTQFFATELLPYWGIEGKVVGIAPTELVQLEVHKQSQDFNLVMEDGSWKHFEFQSKNEGIKGLKRFRNYEATASYHHNVEITTYVLYSGRVKNPITEFTEGINTYRVHPIIMQNKNADELLHRLEEKIENQGNLTKDEVVPVVLCLLMSGESTLKDRVKRSINITRASKSVAEEDIIRMEMVIYTMADKFLDELEMEEVREMIKMTKLGQIILRDGRIEERIDLVSKKLAKGKSIAEISDALEISETEVEELIKEYNLI